MSDDVKVLNLGCGSRKIRNEEVGLDIKKPCDVLWDLNKHPLPFKDEEFDEIYAYHVLEHLGSQGDFRFFFEEFNEYWRILKPGGLMRAVVPLISSIWAWGDPGHTRIFPETWLQFLLQETYESQIGMTGMADYRFVYKANFKRIFTKTLEGVFLEFVLQKD